MLPFDDGVWSLKPVKTGKLTVVHAIMSHHLWIIRPFNSDYIIHMYGRDGLK